MYIILCAIILGLIIGCIISVREKYDGIKERLSYIGKITTYFTLMGVFISLIVFAVVIYPICLFTPSDVVYTSRETIEIEKIDAIGTYGYYILQDDKPFFIYKVRGGNEQKIKYFPDRFNITHTDKVMPSIRIYRGYDNRFRWSLWNRIMSAIVYRGYYTKYEVFVPEGSKIPISIKEMRI